MKKVKNISFWLLLMMSMTTVVFHACEEEEQPAEQTVAVTGIRLSKETLSLVTGAEDVLVATVEPVDATDNTVTWTSSDAEKASVANGKVKAVAEGKATITAKAGNKTATCAVTVKDPPVSVVINGVKWATRNVDEPGKFADKPETFGKFYQWNRKVAWTVLGNVTGWNNTAAAGTEWAKENDPSPEGWRVPTVDEMNDLRDPEKVKFMFTKQNNTNGWKFIDKASGDSLFLPLPGFRSWYDGGLFAMGANAYYWHNTVPPKGNDHENAGCFNFDLYLITGTYEHRGHGYNVRSVAAK